MDKMDAFNLSLSAISLSSTHKKFAWPGGPSAEQLFSCSLSFPDSIIYFITKNPSSPKAYSKLIQSCKYFFENNPIIVVPRIHCNMDSVFCPCYNENGCLGSDCECYIKGNVDLEKIKSKIWLTEKLDIYKKVFSNFVSILVSKLYRCEEDAGLLLEGHETSSMSLKDFKLLASKFQRFSLLYNSIDDNDGNLVMLETILEAIPNVKEFDYGFDNDTATPLTMKNICKLKNFNNLQRFSLYAIPEVIYVKDLADFILSHRNTRIKNIDFRRKTAKI